MFRVKWKPFLKDLQHWESGTGALRSGMDVLLQGSQTITTNLETLDNGLEQAKDGSEQLNQALTQLPTLMQGIGQIRIRGLPIYLQDQIKQHKVLPF